MVRFSPRTSAFMREMFGDEVVWSITDHLIAGVLDYAALIAWLNSDTKRNDRPEPIERPGTKPKNKVLGTAVAVKDFDRLWAENLARSQPEAGDGPDVGGSGTGDPEHHSLDAGSPGSD